MTKAEADGTRTIRDAGFEIAALAREIANDFSSALAERANSAHCPTDSDIAEFVGIRTDEVRMLRDDPEGASLGLWRQFIGRFRPFEDHFGRCQIDWLADAIRAELTAGTLWQRATLRMLANIRSLEDFNGLRQDWLRDKLCIDLDLTTHQADAFLRRPDNPELALKVVRMMEKPEAGGEGSATANELLRQFADGAETMDAPRRQEFFGELIAALTARQQRAGPPDGETEADGGTSPVLLAVRQLERHAARLCEAAVRQERAALDALDPRARLGLPSEVELEQFTESLIGRLALRSDRRGGLKGAMRSLLSRGDYRAAIEIKRAALWGAVVEALEQSRRPTRPRRDSRTAPIVPARDLSVAALRKWITTRALEGAKVWILNEARDESLLSIFGDDPHSPNPLLGKLDAGRVQWRRVHDRHVADDMASEESGQRGEGERVPRYEHEDIPRGELWNFVYGDAGASYEPDPHARREWLSRLRRTLGDRTTPEDAELIEAMMQSPHAPTRALALAGCGKRLHLWHGAGGSKPLGGATRPEGGSRSAGGPRRGAAPTAERALPHAGAAPRSVRIRTRL